MTHRNGTAAAPRPYLTTGQLARGLGVAMRTVAAWVDRGEFPGAWRLPPASGSEARGHDRRIPVASAANWCRAHGLPVPAGWDAGPPAVLAVGLPPALLDQLRVALAPVVVVEAADGFAAGTLAESRVYAAAVVDAAGVGTAAAKAVLDGLGRLDRWRAAARVALAVEDDAGAWPAGAVVVRPPYGAADVAAQCGGGQS